MSKATGISRLQREANYAEQPPSNWRAIRPQTPKQKRRIKQKENRLIQSPENRTTHRSWIQGRRFVRKPAIFRRQKEHKPCPVETCGQSGPWETNPCLTASGRPAKKAHAGREL